MRAAATRRDLHTNYESHTVACQLLRWSSSPCRLETSRACASYRPVKFLRHFPPFPTLSSHRVAYAPTRSVSLAPPGSCGSALSPYNEVRDAEATAHSKFPRAPSPLPFPFSSSPRRRKRGTRVCTQLAPLRRHPCQALRRTPEEIINGPEVGRWGRGLVGNERAEAT